MQAADRKRFVTLLSGVADYYGKELSNAVIGLYWKGMEQFDIADVERALWEHTQNPDAGQFMPKIADVMRMVHGLTSDQAALAWSKVDTAVRYFGTYNDVVFDDALIHRVVVEIGGWIWLGNQVEDEWPHVAKRFEKLYCAYRVRGLQPPHVPVLTGITNTRNALEGREINPPMLLGDAVKVQEVRESGGCVRMHWMQRSTGIFALDETDRLLEQGIETVRPFAGPTDDQTTNPISESDTKEAT